MGLRNEPNTVHSYEDPASFSGSSLWTEFSNWVVDSIKYYAQNPMAIMNELLSGLMVSILQVPESVAFSYVAGVHPMQGLYGSFWMGLTTAIFGGRPGMISGCAGALAVVIKEVMMDSGPFGDKCPQERREYLFFVMVLTGMMQLVCGLCYCANLVKLIPKTAFLGFFNGLAIVIFLSQLQTFRKSADMVGAAVAAMGNDIADDDDSGNFSDGNFSFFSDDTSENDSSALGNSTFESGSGCAPPPPPLQQCSPVDYGFQPDREWYTLADSTTWWMLMEILIVMLFMFGIPYLDRKYKCGKVRFARLVPPSLIGLLSAMAYEWGIVRPLGWSTPLVKDMSRISGGLPVWHVPDVPWGRWETWSKSLPVAGSLCAIGLVESVLTLQAVDQILEQQTSIPKKNQECLAQGLANLLSGFFKAMGGDAMIGQSTINVLNGAQGRLSAFTAAAFMLLFIWVLGDFIEAVPTAALCGILFVVVIHTFNWSSISIILRRALPLYMCVTIVLVTVLSVLVNLAIGILVGILWESLFFVWREGSRLNVTPIKSDRSKTYKVEGSLFFVNSDEFNSHFTPKEDPPEVFVDFANGHVLDFSGLYTLNVLSKRYASARKRLFVRVQDEDFERYRDLCDEEELKQQSSLRRYLPTESTKGLHNRVSAYRLQHWAPKEFDVPLRRGQRGRAPFEVVPAGGGAEPRDEGRGAIAAADRGASCLGSRPSPHEDRGGGVVRGGPPDIEDGVSNVSTIVKEPHSDFDNSAESMPSFPAKIIPTTPVQAPVQASGLQVSGLQSSGLQSSVLQPSTITQLPYNSSHLTGRIADATISSGMKESQIYIQTKPEGRTLDSGLKEQIDIPGMLDGSDGGTTRKDPEDDERSWVSEESV